MKQAITDAIVEKALDPKLSRTEALNILTDSADIKVGQKVAILDGTPYGLDGLQGVAKGPSNKNSGFINVELPNRTIVPIPANLLVAL